MIKDRTVIVVAYHDGWLIAGLLIVLGYAFPERKLKLLEYMEVSRSSSYDAHLFIRVAVK